MTTVPVIPPPIARLNALPRADRVRCVQMATWAMETLLPSMQAIVAAHKIEPDVIGFDFTAQQTTPMGVALAEATEALITIRSRLDEVAGALGIEAYEMMLDTLRWKAEGRVVAREVMAALGAE